MNKILHLEREKREKVKKGFERSANFEKIATNMAKIARTKISQNSTIGKRQGQEATNWLE